MTPSTAAPRLALLLAALGALPASIAAPRISQVVDQAPDIVVFLADTAGVFAATPASAPGHGLSASLGSLVLALKQAAPADPGAAVALVVALDVSASLGTANFDLLKQRLNLALTTLPPDSRVALLAIGVNVARVRAFGEVPTADWAELRRLRPDAPQTALYEGMLAAQALAAESGSGLPMRRAVLLITDGLDDNNKGFGPDETLKRITDGQAPVYALALAPAKPAKGQAEAIKSLARIARASGGGLVQSTPASLASDLGLLMAQLRQVDRVTFDCTACVRDGMARVLQVNLSPGEAAAGDSREIRLQPLPPAPTPAPAPPSLPPPPEDKSWLWVLLAALAVVAAGAAAWMRRRSGTVPAVFASADIPGDLSLVAARSRAQNSDAPNALAVTLDIAGAGRMQLRIGSVDVVLGRSAEAKVSTAQDTEASNKHAALYREKGALMLRDLGSSNGTFLNGTRIVRPEPVHDRDHLVIGRTDIRVYLEPL